MVVLSACETGLGKFASGKAVFGLLRGFQEAGTDSVVISTWKVPDAQTQQLMTGLPAIMTSLGAEEFADDVISLLHILRSRSTDARGTIETALSRFELAA